MVSSNTVHGALDRVVIADALGAKFAPPPSALKMMQVAASRGVGDDLAGVLARAGSIRSSLDAVRSITQLQAQYASAAKVAKLAAAYGPASKISAGAASRAATEAAKLFRDQDVAGARFAPPPSALKMMQVAASRGVGDDLAGLLAGVGSTKSTLDAVLSITQLQKALAATPVRREPIPTPRELIEAEDVAATTAEAPASHGQLATLGALVRHLQVGRPLTRAERKYLVKVLVWWAVCVQMILMYLDDGLARELSVKLLASIIAVPLACFLASCEDKAD